jgi:hypothetical protein
VVTHLRVIFFSVLFTSVLRSSSVNVRCMAPPDRSHQLASGRFSRRGLQGASHSCTCISSAARIVRPRSTVGYP